MKKLLLSFFSLVFCLALNAQTTILDFETPATSTTYQYFGSTLDGSVNNIIANPDPSGINTSAMAADYVKASGAETWAGAFANPALATSADMTTYGEVCVKVWFDQPGNLALKLEQSTDGGPDWITTQEVTETQTWTELCFDVSENSIEAPNTPAAGFNYAGVVLFFDFGIAGAATDVTYYWDDLITKGMSTGGTDPVQVDMAVDMNNFTGSFTTAFISGSFNGWEGGTNPMVDTDGDGVWQTSLLLVPGTYEYKFQLDEWTVQEEFTDGDPCTITDPSGEFVNRVITISEDATVCFEYNTCTSCEFTNVRDLTVDHTLFELSPNVTSGFANLSFSDKLTEAKTVRIFNANGSMLSETQLGVEVSQHQLDLSEVAAGLYFVSVQTETQLATQKLIRQ